MREKEIFTKEERERGERGSIWESEWATWYGRGKRWTLRVFEMYAARAFLSVVLANDRVNIQTSVKLHILSTRGKGRDRLERIVKRSWEKRRERERERERELRRTKECEREAKK